MPIGCLILRMQRLGLPPARVARAIELVGAKLLPAPCGDSDDCDAMGEGP